MTTIKRISGITLACLATAIMGFAQVAAPSEKSDDDPGLLGKRYVGVSLRTVDYRDSSASNGFGESVGVNIPINQHFDVDAGYSRFRQSDYGFVFRSTDIGAGATAHTLVNGFKPFVDAGIGYNWSQLSGHFLSLHDETAFYNAGVGVERPICKAVSLALHTGFTEDIPSHAGPFWSHSIHGVYWFAPRVAASGMVSFNESVSITYSAGIRLVF